MSQLTRLFDQTVFAIVMLVVSCTLVKATTVKNRKDDVEITVTTKKDYTGKTLIDCTLYNQSPHTIATINLQTPSSVFYFQLFDRAGNVIQQDPEWAKSFAQKISWRYNRPRSMRLDVINPGENQKFQFFLEDAYGTESPKGHIMAISWESQYLDDIIDTNAYKNDKGEQVERGEKKYMFPPKWDISVRLRVNEDAAEGTKEIKVASLGENSSSNKITGIRNSSNSMAKVGSTEKVIPEKMSYLWWLLSIPLVLLGRYVLAQKKRS